jgi:hypothetical protein
MESNRSLVSSGMESNRSLVSSGMESNRSLVSSGKRYLPGKEREIKRLLEKQNFHPISGYDFAEVAHDYKYGDIGPIQKIKDKIDKILENNIYNPKTEKQLVNLDAKLMIHNERANLLLSKYLKRLNQINLDLLQQFQSELFKDFNTQQYYEKYLWNKV